MSISSSREPWGPTHEHLPPPSRHRSRWKLGAIGLFLIILELAGYPARSPQRTERAHLGGAHHHPRRADPHRRVAPRPRADQRTTTPALRPRRALAGEPPGRADRRRREPSRGHPFTQPPARRRRLSRDRPNRPLGHAPTPSTPSSSSARRARARRAAVVIPALLAAPGAAVSTSTKPDVWAPPAARARAARSGCSTPAARNRRPPDIRQLCWSPVAAADSWDEALLMARAMAAAAPAGRGTNHEQHWSERATALLAPLLHAANAQSDPSRAFWAGCCATTSTPPASTRGSRRRRSPTTSSLASARPTAASAHRSSPPPPASSPPTTPTPPAAPPPTPTSTPTGSPLHRHHLHHRPRPPASPRRATRRRAARADPPRHLPRATSNQRAGPPVFFCLDEVANIAPIHDLPALVSEAGGRAFTSSPASKTSPKPAPAGARRRGRVPLPLPNQTHAPRHRRPPHPRSHLPRPRRIRPQTGLPDHRAQPTSRVSRPPHRLARSVTYHTQRHRTLTPGEIHACRPGTGTASTARTGGSPGSRRGSGHSRGRGWRRLTPGPNPTNNDRGP